MLGCLCLPSTVLDAVFLEILFAPFHLLFFSTAIFPLPLLAFLMFLVFLHLIKHHNTQI